MRTIIKNVKIIIDYEEEIRPDNKFEEFDQSDDWWLEKYGFLKKESKQQIYDVPFNRPGLDKLFITTTLKNKKNCTNLDSKIINTSIIIRQKKV